MSIPNCSKLPRTLRSVLIFTTQSRLSTTLRKRALENSVGKGENAGNQHFLLFPQCFLLYQKEKLIDWSFTPLLTVFQSYHGDSSHYSCLSWVSPVLGWGSEVSCPRRLPRKTQRIRCGSSQTLYH